MTRSPADPTPRDAARRRRIDALGPWFHNLHLPDGTQTCPEHPLGDFPAQKWRELESVLPARLDGWTVLDIGCNAGFYSFELARRGATVTAIDREPLYLEQARFAAAEFGLADRIRFRRMQVYDLIRDAERYDLVLFMGVFYHLRYPLLGLDLVTRRVQRLLVFQTLSMPGDEMLATPPDVPLDERAPLAEPGWPKMAFIEERLAGDRTNWWAPNRAACEAMLRSCGMRVTARPGRELYVCEPDPDHPSCIDTWNGEELLAATGALRGG